ncbi:hypothetical protein AMK26_32170 [Streptomyces sp. CB03234]|uniref:hypothetical protein n=1 Tax=Streptomyces sp. (strain CB03234) TaxID=1703937 RepID=UPI00093BCD93|nr:hypothetical protein [Streptomyces sp. CB03234]OKJ94494.1 hypothetical protein AMK26_32170 [Streptomyces sp. CB03234]
MNLFTTTTAWAGSQERPRDADAMAVASFITGLVGLLVFNLVLGPCALVLGTAALARRTSRRSRAILGLALGAADLIVLAALVALAPYGVDFDAAAAE